MASRKRSAGKQKETDWSSLPLYLNMRKRALRDPLTDFYHRNRMLDELDLVMLMARSHRHPFAVAVIDVDGLKNINDSIKRSGGDQVLAEASDLIRKSARVMDFICRTGGDEFAVILPKSSADGARVFGERLLRRIREHVFCKGTHKIRMTATAGILVLGPGHRILSSINVLDRVMEELKKAKKLGGDRYSLAGEPDED